MLKDSLKKSLSLSLVCICASYSTIEGANLWQKPQNPSSHSSQPACNEECQSSRITARHIENKGIGYNTGYTTVEMFLATPTNLWPVMPFIDLRGHIFNDGHWAANGGIGLRSLLKNRVYGIYGYYDYRDTKRKHYNQASFGVETLGTFWDLRLNGYIVFGSRQSKPYDTEFSQFAGNSIYYAQKIQYALSGGNGEVGLYPLKMKDVTLYTGIGPYYLKGPVGTAVWGGQARIKAMWKDYVGAEVNYSYDHKFKNIVQGQLFVSVPLGPKDKIRGNKERSCIDKYLLCQRMIDPVAKNEIIPVTTKTNKNIAINPTTQQPYTVYFVNNLSHSAGTYESPFSTLAAAENASQENDLIYVYPGDLTSNGLSSGITLQNGQQLLGATFNQSLMTTAGEIIIPAQATGNNPPLLSNAAGAVVTLGNNNVVSGLYIQNTAGVGILASGSNNATLTQNYIQGNSLTYNGIELDNTTGTIAVSSNTIMYQAACVNINNSIPISNASYLFANNTLHSEDGSYGFNIAYTEGSNNYFLSSNNNLYASESAAINIACSNTTNNEPHVFDIINNNIGTEDDYAVQLALNNDSVAQLNVQDSTINSSYGIYTVSSNNSQLSANITNNVFNVYEYAIEPETGDNSFTNLVFTGNSINAYEYPIYIDSAGNSTLAININNNTMNCAEYAFYIDLSGSAALTGTFSNNILIISDDDGNYIDAVDNSYFGVDINNNVIHSIYDHIYVSLQTSASYVGNIIGNTFVGQDDDDTIIFEMNTSGTVSSRIADNVFTGNFYAVDLINGNTGVTTFEILDNTIQNSSHSGVYISNTGTNLQATVSGNTFQGFGTNAVTIGNGAGTTYLHFNDNSSNPYPNAYVISGTGGTLNLYTPTGNLGQLQTTGITPVSQRP